MRLNETKYIPLIDVDITHKCSGNKVRVKVKPAAITSSHTPILDVEFCLTKKQTTQLIKMLKAQRDRIK